MKLLSTAIAAAALITAADAKGFNGFYAGAELGVSNLNSKWRVGAKGEPKNRDELRSGNLSSSIGFFLGYNKVFANCMSAGIEFGGDFIFKKKGHIGDSGTRIYKMKRSGFDWDLVAKAGTLINTKTLAFVGFGIKSKKVHYNYSEVDTTPGTLSIKSSKIRPTYQFGFENLMTNDSVALRLVYSFTQGSKKSISTNKTGFDFSPNIVSSVKNNEHQVKLGISYRF